MNVFIYTLSCPDSLMIMYIGKCNRINYRYNQHVTDFRDTAPVKEWIKSLVLSGKKPVMEIIEECENAKGSQIENYWIWQFKTWGFNLLNRKDILGSFKHSEESKIKISTALTGRRLSIEAVEKLGRKVCKYDLNGNYIETYISESEALRMNGIKFGIRSAIDRNKTAAGFKWKWL